MKTIPQRQAVIAPLAKPHRLALSQGEAHQRLARPSYPPLVIETIGVRCISLAHYFEQNGDWLADPDVVFFTGDGAWVPIAITQAVYWR